MELEYLVVGEGETALVFEVGIGNSFYQWAPLIDQLKNDFKVILYHRAGYGNSSPSELPRTVSIIAEELDALVEMLEIDEFVLAGHSYGGLCAQQYARMFPGKLKAVLLIDATSHHFKRLYDLDLPVMYSMISLEKLIEGNLQTSKKSKAELTAMFMNNIEESKRMLPEKDGDKYQEFITQPELFKTVADELTNWPKSSLEIKLSEDFPDIPLIVIARDQDMSAKPFIEHGIPEEEANLHEQVWRELQVELAALSSKGELIIAEGSDHEIHKDRPEIIMECLERFK
jgi:pimeloyl-ACP methyl ester carboxylesterase